MSTINLLFSAPDLTEETPTPDMPPQVFRAHAHRKFKNRMREATIEGVIDELPEEGKGIHILSNSFDGFSVWQRVFDLADERVPEMIITTWTINREYTNTLMSWLDSGRVGRLSMLTGLYFKSREAALYSYLAERMKQRAMPFKAIEIHTKVALMRTASGRCFVMEGSANMTGNPRIEQNVVYNSPPLFRFYKDAFDTLFAA